MAALPAILVAAGTAAATSAAKSAFNLGGGEEKSQEQSKTLPSILGALQPAVKQEPVQIDVTAPNDNLMDALFTKKSGGM